MITVLKNDDDYVYAYIGWETVNDLGQNTEQGRFLFIYDLWVHPHHRGMNIVNKFIYLLNQDPRTQSAEWVYWEREKKYQLKQRFFNKERVLRKERYHVE